MKIRSRDGTLSRTRDSAKAIFTQQAASRMEDHKLHPELVSCICALEATTLKITPGDSQPPTSRISRTKPSLAESQGG